MTRRQARVTALRVSGLWTATDGQLIPIGTMPAGHLINAYLRALANQEPEFAQPLAIEVVRRGLAEAAWREAQRRS